MSDHHSFSVGVQSYLECGKRKGISRVNIRISGNKLIISNSNTSGDFTCRCKDVCITETSKLSTDGLTINFTNDNATKANVQELAKVIELIKTNSQSKEKISKSVPVNNFKTNVSNKQPMLLEKTTLEITNSKSSTSSNKSNISNNYNTKLQTSTIESLLSVPKNTKTSYKSSSYEKPTHKPSHQISSTTKIDSSMPIQTKDNLQSSPYNLQHVNNHNTTPIDNFSKLFRDKLEHKGSNSDVKSNVSSPSPVSNNTNRLRTNTNDDKYSTSSHNKQSYDQCSPIKKYTTSDRDNSLLWNRNSLKNILLQTTPPLKTFESSYSNMFRHSFFENKRKRDVSLLDHDWHMNEEDDIFEINKKHRNNNSDNNTNRLLNSLTSSSNQFIGIRNIGNSCYINVILQAVLNLNVLINDLQAPLWNTLLNTPTSNTTTMNDTSNNNTNNNNTNNTNSIISEICKLYKQKNKSKKDNVCTTLDISSLKNCLSKHVNRFFGYGQHDAHEFLCYLIMVIEDECSKKILDIYSKDAQVQSSTGNLLDQSDNNDVNNTHRSSMQVQATPLSSNSNVLYQSKSINNCQRMECPNITTKKISNQNNSKLTDADDTLLQSILTHGLSSVFNKSSILSLVPTIHRLTSTVDMNLTCTHCCHMRTLHERYSDFSLEYPYQKEDYSDNKVYDMSDMMKSFFQTEFRNLECEKCSGGNEHVVSTDDHSNKGMVEVVPSISHCADILIIHLKRFQYDSTTNQFIKLHNKTKFPKYLDISPYMTKPTTSSNSMYETSNGDTPFVDDYKNVNSLNGISGGSENDSNSINISNESYKNILSHSISDVLGDSHSNVNTNTQMTGSNNCHEKVVTDEIVDRHENECYPQSTATNKMTTPHRLEGNGRVLDSICASDGANGVNLNQYIADDGSFTPWECEYCTFVNEDTKLICAMCDQPIRQYGSTEKDQINKNNNDTDCNSALKEDNNGTIATPLLHNFSVPTVTPLLSNSTLSDPSLFSLVGVVRHFGMTGTSGHYTCDIREVLHEETDSNQQNISKYRWKNCNDSKVVECTEEKVFADMQTPYILFYQRSNL